MVVRYNRAPPSVGIPTTQWSAVGGSKQPKLQVTAEELLSGGADNATVGNLYVSIGYTATQGWQTSMYLAILKEQGLLLLRLIVKMISLVS